MRYAAILLVAATLLVGCGTDDPAIAEDVLAVRAVYVQPEFEGAAATFNHETIPGLMDAMQMAFPLADKALLDGLTPGQKVTISIAQEPRLEVVAIAPLPDSTTLTLAPPVREP